MKPIPHFIAKLLFTFREHGEERMQSFHFGEDGHRRVPMLMDGVPDMYTLGMFRDGPAIYRTGDTALVSCVIICAEPFDAFVKPGAKFELWDGGFFASGEVTERVTQGWEPPIQNKLS